MSSGFVCRNSDGLVLVSDTSKSMYFIGKGVAQTPIGGGYYADIALSTATLYVFSLGSPVSFPLIFVSCPTGRCSVLRTYKEGTVYKADVIAIGNSSVPEIYVFANKADYSGADKVGIKVVRSDGTSAYDSRLGKILNLRDSTPVDFFANDRALVSLPNRSYSGRSKGISYYTTVYGRESLDTDNQRPVPVTYNTKPAVAINTLAICCRTSNYVDSTTYFDGYGTVQNIYYWTYAIYRGGFTVNSTSSVSLCWVPHVATSTYTYTTTYPSGNSWGDPPGYSDVGSGGTPPYANQSLNLVGGTLSVINGADYD